MFIKLSHNARFAKRSTPSCGRIDRPSAFVIVLVVFGLFGLAGNHAWTQEVAPSGAIAFNIPSQPLAHAIQAFSQASGVEVFYESSIAAGRTSANVEGRHPPDAALRALLGGAGFTIRFTRRNAVVLSIPSAQNDLPPTRALANFDLSLDTIRVTASPERGGDTRLREFGDMVQSEVESALRKNTKIRSGNYRVRVKLWIAPSRTVQRAELAQSTGDLDRDIAITGVLQGFVVSRVPPANTPQPIRVIVAVRSL